MSNVIDGRCPSVVNSGNRTRVLSSSSTSQIHADFLIHMQGADQAHRDDVVRDLQHIASGVSAALQEVASEVQLACQRNGIALQKVIALATPQHFLRTSTSESPILVKAAGSVPNEPDDSDLPVAVVVGISMATVFACGLVAVGVAVWRRRFKAERRTFDNMPHEIDESGTAASNL